MIIKPHTVDDLKQSLIDLDIRQDEFCLIFVGEFCPILTDDIIHIFNELNVLFLGSIVPAVFDKEGADDKGILIKRLRKIAKNYHVISDKGAPELKQKLSSCEECSSMFLLLDEKNTNKQDLLYEVYNILPDEINLIGAVVGNEKSNRSTAIFHNEGGIKEDLVVVTIREQITPESHHGFKKLYGPLLLNTNEQHIEYINWRNAKEIYTSVLADVGDTDLASINNEPREALKFPLGIYKGENECILRDIYIEGDKLMSYAPIKNDTVVSIMTYEVNALIQSTIEAITTLMQNSQQTRLADLFLIDCTSRRHIVGKDYGRKMNLIHEATTPIVEFSGIMSLGEIILKDSTPIEVHNLTLISTLFYNE